MDDLVQVFVFGVVAGFGLSVFVDVIGAGVGRTLAIFDGV